MIETSVMKELSGYPKKKRIEELQEIFSGLYILDHIFLNGNKFACFVNTKG